MSLNLVLTAVAIHFGTVRLRLCAEKHGVRGFIQHGGDLEEDLCRTLHDLPYPRMNHTFCLTSLYEFPAMIGGNIFRGAR